MNIKSRIQSQVTSHFENADDNLLVTPVSNLKSAVDNAKTVIFSGEQARVFLDAGAVYSEKLEYMLPFESVILQFTPPIQIKREGKSELCIAIILNQTLTPFEKLLDDKIVTTNKPMTQEALSLIKGSNFLLNLAFAVTSNFDIGFHSWLSNGPFEIAGDPRKSEFNWSKGLAIACIGYINCENVYLHQEGGAPEAVNRKRESKGKTRLEPYYTCRIRGVQYDSNGNPTGEGSHHGFIYDVRGHFRKLTSGKTTWVRPHQRGLQSGGLYIPKTYIVDRVNQ